LENFEKLYGNKMVVNVSVSDTNHVSISGYDRKLQDHFKHFPRRQCEGNRPFPHERPASWSPQGCFVFVPEVSLSNFKLIHLTFNVREFLYQFI
jgi:hypothetical protein